MADRAVLITALIVERPLCISCIAAKSLMTVERATEALKVVGTAVVLTTRTDRCAACDETVTVYTVERTSPS